MPYTPADWELFLARTQLVFFMLGVGATLTVSDFGRVLRYPKTLIYCLVCQLWVPFVAVGICTLFGLDEVNVETQRQGLPGIAIGLIIIALLPGGSLSKLFNLLGRGDTPLCVCYTMFASLLALITVPLYLKWLAFEYVPDDFVLPARLVVVPLAVFMLLPLILGLTFGYFFPRWRDTFSVWCIRVGWVIVVAMVSLSLWKDPIDLTRYDWRVPTAIILYCVVAQQLAMLPFYILKWPRADRMTCGVEVTMRNLNLALLLLPTLFPLGVESIKVLRDGVLFVVLFYAPTGFAAGGLLALNHMRLAKRADARARQANEMVEPDNAT